MKIRDTKFKKFVPLIGVIILVIILSTTDIEKVAKIMSRVSPIHIVLALLLSIPRILMDNYKWQMVLKHQKISLDFFSSLKIYMIGLFYGSLTPGWIGNLIRIPYVKEKSKESLGKCTSNVLIDAILESIALYFSAFVGAILLMKYFPNLLPITLAFLIIILSISLYFIKEERGKKPLQTILKLLIPRDVKKKFHSPLNSFYEDIPSVKNLMIPFLIALLSRVVYFSQVYIFAKGLPIDIPYMYFIAIYPIGVTIGNVPITIGGLGVREGSLIVLFSIFGIPAEESLALSLGGFFIAGVVPSLLGAIISVYEGRT